MDRRESAIGFLETLRHGTDDYESALRYLRREARKGGFSLPEIGTNEEELTHLRKKGCVTRSRMWLNAIRGGVGDPQVLCGFIREELMKGGLTCTDIGTSEEELSFFITIN